MGEGFETVRVPVTPDGRVKRADAARYIGCETRTLAEWHRLGKGPRSVLVGGRRFYRVTDLQAFVGDNDAVPA